MIRRVFYREALKRALERSPIVALLGPRQCGKTTLAREFCDEKSSHYFDLEDPLALHMLEQPMTTLRGLEGCVVIDEIQRRPELFPILRVLADQSDLKATFLILGSASPDLSRQAAESLAGRVEIIEMKGFDLSELEAGVQDRLWIRGGFPKSFLSQSDENSFEWRRNFIRTYLERDLAQLGFGITPLLMNRFWTMLAHYHGQIWNAQQMAASLGVAPNTAKRYLDVLEQTYMVRRLLPWHENLGKRLVKSPKIYFRDSGLFHSLCGIHDFRELLVHPLIGASWEGFALEKILYEVKPDEFYFYAVHSGSELDLMMIKGGKRFGIEFKRSDKPTITKSIRIAMNDLDLESVKIVYPGNRRFYLEEKIEVVPLHEPI